MWIIILQCLNYSCITINIMSSSRDGNNGSILNCARDSTGPCLGAHIWPHAASCGLCTPVIKLLYSSFLHATQYINHTGTNICRETVKPMAKLTHISVWMVNKNSESWQYLLDHVHLWWRLFTATKVHHHPGHVAQEWQRDCRIHERN